MSEQTQDQMPDQLSDEYVEVISAFGYAIAEELFRILRHWHATNDPRFPKHWPLPKSVNECKPPKEVEASYAWQTRHEPPMAARVSAYANQLAERGAILWRADHQETEIASQTLDSGESGEPITIHNPPAHFLAIAAKFILSKAAYQRYVEPHVLDIRTEHYEALQAGELRKAQWIVIRGYCQALWPLVVAVWGTIAALVKLST